MDKRLITKLKDDILDIKDEPVCSFGSSLIVAPHPDDETLGCGGTVALLLREHCEVNFIFVSDGAMSHPNSKKYPAAKLRDLREKEAIKAVRILGGCKENIEFLALPDRNVPSCGRPYFESLVRFMIRHIERLAPQTVFVPWQNDPHPDHQASWQILSEAISRLSVKPRLLQYPIWLWEMGSDQDILLIQNMHLISVNIETVLEIKQRALAAHESQVSGLIDDDPEGFQLSEQVIAHFNNPREIFFEL